DPVIDRQKWLEWSDDFYKVEKKRFGLVVAEVESRLFKSEYVRIEGDAKNPIKINDIIRFRYKNEFMYLNVNNCEWNVGENESKVVASQCVYGGSEITQLPPFVNAGEDKTFPHENYSVFLNDAVAVSPFGNIESYLWEIVSTDGSGTISGNTNLVAGLNVFS